MFEHIKIQSLDDFFLKLNERPQRGVYFYRAAGYNEQAGRLIRKYYEAARSSGVIIEGKIPNPDEKNLAYYSEVMGMDFSMQVDFIKDSLKKWLPRMNDEQRKNVASALYDTLDVLRKSGKTEHMLKNAYIKFMCWLYYRFERIVNRLGENEVPKILLESDLTNYELLLLSMLSKAGCDILLLQLQGDENYRKLDAAQQLSDELKLQDAKPFPQSFRLKCIREEIQKEMNKERLYGKRPKLLNCTNAWHDGGGLSDLKKDAQQRGNDPNLFYNCFLKISGVQDKASYAGQLYQFQLALKNSGRRMVIINEGIPRPAMEEIAAVHRKHYENKEQMLLDLSANIRYPADLELQRLMVKAFVDVFFMEAETQAVSLNRLVNQAVYIICWLKRYQGGLFGGLKLPECACFILMGGCREESEALFVKLLARLPVDVLVLCPDLKRSCCLKDSLLYEINYENSVQLSAFPQEDTDVHIGTAAYHAERELDELMYQDSGIYRNQQYEKANAVILQTMYEEIKILWDEEVRYRPNFSTVEGAVNIPVICAKVSGVKDGAVSPYWRFIKELVTEDTFVIKKAPFIEPAASNPMKAYAAEFYKNGKLRKEKIKNHAAYPYGFLREEIQDYILDKLQALIDKKIVKGTFENGAEYAAIAQVLNLPKEIVRLIQKFDFTKKNPKLIYINTQEAMLSLEDTILTAFLNLAGFDILFFVPTGYQNVEKYFNKRIMEEHQIGEYVYDLRVPNLDGLPFARPKWRDIIFKRGK